MRLADEPTEGDVAVFVELRRWFAAEGARLLDALVFTDDYRCWSMHELTTGSTAWSFTRPEGAIGPIGKSGRQ